jgi:hypothetical protein
MVYVVVFLIVAILVRMFFLESEDSKLRAKNKLLCKENHRLRLKLKSHENNSKEGRDQKSV